MKLELRLLETFVAVLVQKCILNKECERPVTIATQVSCSPLHHGEQSLEQHMRLLQPHSSSNVTKRQTTGELLFEKLCTELLTYFLVAKFLIALEVQIL